MGRDASILRPFFLYLPIRYCLAVRAECVPETPLLCKIW